jgi:hypothetical protein
MAYMKDQDYVWNNNQFKCETGSIYSNMNRYALDAPNQANYHNAAMGYVHYIHGINPNRYCYLTNSDAFGADYPIMQIYHGWFGDGTIYDSTANYIGPPPGYLSCGANAYYTPDVAYAGPPISPPQNQPTQKCYKDWNTSWPENSWEVTEVGIYTEAAYIKLLSLYADTTSITMSVPQNPVVAAWSISPNPASNFISVTGPQAEQVELQLFDLQGKMVLSQQVISGGSVSTAELPAAVYLCVIRREDAILSTQKISITR